MVQSNLVERFDTVVSVMTEAEARECVVKINVHMNGARALLLDLYERRGWVALGYQSWRECVVAEFEQSQSVLYAQLQAAEIERRISDVSEKPPIPLRQLLPLAQLTPIEQPIAWQEANERSNGKPTSKVVEQVVREMLDDEDDEDPPSCYGSCIHAVVLSSDYDRFFCKKFERDYHMQEGWELAPECEFYQGTPEVPEDDALDPPPDPIEIPLPTPMAVHFSSATPEWYTPRHVIERVLSLFGEIDLDPCSNAYGAAANVPAGEHFTIADDGLSQQWHGRVYMNPPYGDEIGQWTARLLQAYADQEIDEAIALLPARTDTAWFRPLMAHRCCFVHGRLKFSESKDSAPFPSVIVYLGPDRENFIEYFSDIGTIMERV